MPLKNEQYDRILREYDQRQLENRHLLQEKQEAVYQKIPALKEIDLAIASNAVHATKLTLSGDEQAIEKLRTFNAELSENKQMLLLSHGYPSDYLAPIYTCPDCKDTGYITDTSWRDEEHLLLSKNKCHCFKQAIVDVLYQQSNIRNAIEKENFSTFSYDYYDQDIVDETTGMTAYEHMVDVVARCQNFIQNFDHTFENILFSGDSGVGKTFLSNCIAKELLESAHTVIYLTAFELFDILEKHKFKREQDYNLEEQFQGILDCDLLIIDDLGTEFNNSFISSQLYLCLNERLLARRSTIISTNFTIDELNAQYSERILSRIIGNYHLLKLFGRDIRLKKKLLFTP